MTAWENCMTEEESSAATQVVSCKFRSQFSAKTMTFTVVRMGEEFLKRSDPRKPQKLNAEIQKRSKVWGS